MEDFILRKIKKIIINLISIACIFTMLTLNASAYSTTTSGTNTIAPTKDQFKSAKTPTYNDTAHVFNDSIASSYEMDIYHYKTPRYGYYAIYTTGSTDTVGKVFREKNFLFWTTDYEDVGGDDDSGLGQNFRSVLYFNSEEDYYVCTRAYGTKTGSYNLVIEPNDDARESNVGGKWVNDTVDYNALTMGGSYEEISKSYLTPDQVKLYYQLLRNDATRAVIKNSYTSRGAIGTIEELTNLGFTAIDLISIVSPLSVDPIVGNIASIAFLLTEGVCDEIFDSFYEDVDGIGYIMGKLEEVGGAGYTMVDGADVYHATNGVAIVNIAKSQAIILGDNITYIVYYENSYYTYNNSILRGTDYEKGHWE